MKTSRWRTVLCLAAQCLALSALALPAAHARGPWHASERNTGGWQLMTPAERVEYQRRLRGFSSYQACQDYQATHQARIRARARAAGVPLLAVDDSACDELRAQGSLR